MITLLKKLSSRGIAGLSDCIILATLGLIFWFLFMSDSDYKYFKACLSCIGFFMAYLVYWFANRVDDGI